MTELNIALVKFFLSSMRRERGRREGERERKGREMRGKGKAHPRCVYLLDCLRDNSLQPAIRTAVLIG